MVHVSVAELGISPLKSGIYLGNTSTLIFGMNGLFGDREYMFVEAEPHTSMNYKPGELWQPGRFISQREDRVMTQIGAEIGLFGIELDAPDMEPVSFDDPSDDKAERVPVSVWDWAGLGIDMGDAAAEWGREVIGRPVRLVKCDPHNPRYVEGNPQLGVTSFSDGFPLLVTSSGSMDAINASLVKNNREPIDKSTFRPNIVLGSSDLPPFFEDRVASISFTGDSGLVWRAERAKPCSRCVMVNLDPVTGEARGGVLKTLASMGRVGLYADSKYGAQPKPFFGQNFTLLPPEGAPHLSDTLRVGQKVEVSFSDSTNWIPA